MPTTTMTNPIRIDYTKLKSKNSKKYVENAIEFRALLLLGLYIKLYELGVCVMRFISISHILDNLTRVDPEV